MNKKTLINLYYTFIYPFIIYCNIVWGRAPTLHLSKIHILQKQIIRIISHAEFRSHTYVLFKAHQIMNIYQLNKYVTCILKYKHSRGMLPNIFNDIFMKHTLSHNYNMRQHIADKIQHCKTNTKQNTLTYVGPKLWNTVIMKNHIDDCTSMNIFKKIMKQYIWRTY